jgi:WD40 repeat protein
MFTWKAHAKAVLSLRFSPCGRTLLTSGTDEKVRLWDLQTRHELHAWKGSTRWAPVAFSPDGRYVARGGYGIGVWDLADEQDSKPIVGSTAFTEGIAFSPDGKQFVAHGNSGSPLRRWSIPKGDPLAGGWGGVRTSASFPTGPVAWSPDGTTVAALFGVFAGDRFDSVVILYDARTGTETGRLHPRPSVSTHATELTYSPDGKLLAGIYGADMIVWDVAERSPVARLRPGTKHFKGIVFAPNGKTLYAVSNDEAVRAWSAGTWKESPSVERSIGKLSALAINPTGTLAAAGSQTGKVVAWEL